MSSQRTISDVEQVQGADGQTARDSRSWRPTGSARCVCGTPVDREVARVCGIDNVVPACPNCYCTHESNAAYSTVTSAVIHFRDGTGYRRDVTIDVSLHPEVSE
jgi:hypothetical protein